MMSDQYEIIAWALATEGNFTLGVKYYKQESAPVYTPYVAFSNTDKGLIDSFTELAHCGKVYSRQREGNRKRDYSWILTGMETEDFLSKILPFLPAKSPQAKLLLEYCNIRKNVSRKGLAFKLGQNTRTPRETEIFNELKVLNKRGVR